MRFLLELQNSNDESTSKSKEEDDWVQKLPSDHSDEYDDIESNTEVAVLQYPSQTQKYLE